MSEKLWRNDYCRLYEIVEDDCPQLRTMIGVWQVLDREGKRGRVVFYGHHGYGSIWMKEGAVFELVMFEPSVAPDRYVKGQVVMRFSDCRRRLRWIGNPVAISPKDAAYSVGYLSADCDIEWILEGDRDD